MRISGPGGGGEAAEAGMGGNVGDAAQRSTSRFTISSSLTSPSSDLGIFSFSVKHGDFDIGPDVKKYNDVKVKPIAFRRYTEPSVSRVIHHFGVLEVKLPGSNFTMNTLIKFEKGKGRPLTEGANNSRPRGIVTVHLFNEASLDERDPDCPKKVHEVRLPEGCQEILMQELLDHLTTKRTLTYSLWKDNCWKYVYDCQRAMLCAFAELPGTSPVCKESLQEARRNLPKPSLLSDLIHWKNLVTSVFVASPLAGCLAFVGSIFLLYEGARGLRQGGVVLFKAIRFASEAVKTAGVEGLGASLYNVQSIHKILGVQHMHKIQGVYKILEVQPARNIVARFFLGLLSVKGVMMCIGIIIFLVYLWWLGKLVVNNTTFWRDISQWIQQCMPLVFL